MPFDAATIQLQYELLGKTNRGLARDERLLAKQPKNSRSKMADQLRERIAENQRVSDDLEALLRFMEGLNREGDTPACCMAAEQFEHDKNCETRINPEDGAR